MIKISKLLGGFCLLTLPASPLLADAKAEKAKTTETASKKAENKNAHGLDTAEKRISAALGHAVGKQIEGTIGSDIDLDVFFDSVRKVMKKEAPLLNQEETMAAMQDFQGRAQKKMEAEAEANKKILAEKAKETKKASDKFLKENKAKEGIQTTKTGLQYKVVKKGTGKTPTADSEVSVHYEGKLIDGTIFDSSYARGEPATFGVGQVIPGWTEALTMMPVGSEWELYIPSDLAYGERDLPGIPANSVLVFKVELKEIKEAPQAEAPQAEAKAKG